MTVALSATEIVPRLEAVLPGSVVEATGNTIIIREEFLFKVASFLKTTPGFDFDYLNYITAADYQTYFEIIYNLVSLEHNHSLIVKTNAN